MTTEETKPVPSQVPITADMFQTKTVRPQRPLTAEQEKKLDELWTDLLPYLTDAARSGHLMVSIWHYRIGTGLLHQVLRRGFPTNRFDQAMDMLEENLQADAEGIQAKELASMPKPDDSSEGMP